MNALAPWLLAVLAGTGGGAPATPAAPAAPVAAGELVVTLEAADLSAGGDGAGAAFDRVRRGTGGEVWVVGIASHRVGGSRWTVGRLAGALRPADRLALSGELRLGPGRTGERSFTYGSAQAALAYEVVAKRLVLRLEDRYLDIDGSRGNLVTGGLTLLPVPGFTADVAYVRATGGDLGTELVSGRLEIGRGSVRGLAGAARGRSGPQLFDLPGRDGRQRVEEVFAGVGLPVGGGELLLALDRLEAGPVRRWTLTASLRLATGGARR